MAIMRILQPGGRAALAGAAAALLLALAGPAWADDASKTQAERIAAAEAYVRLVPVERMAEKVTRNVMLSLPEEKRELFRNGIAEGLADAGLDRIMVELVAKHFTRAEIEAMTAFYGSGEGQAIERKLPGYMADISLHVIPIIQESVRAVMEEHFE